MESYPSLNTQIQLPSYAVPLPLSLSLAHSPSPPPLPQLLGTLE